MSAEKSDTQRPRMLQRIREAVYAGNRYGSSEEPGPRGQLAYQGVGETDLVQGFAYSLQRAGGRFYYAESSGAVARVIIPILENAGVHRVGISAESLFDEPLYLERRLQGFGLQTWRPGQEVGETAAGIKETLFALDAGITGVDALVAETGTIVLAAKPQRPRSLSLLPRLYVAVARADQIVPDLFDWFGAHPPTTMPSAWTFITGPSKTGDIELTLVTGVHGPGEVHVVVYPA
ncbi:MAG: lactate utilization protein [Gemmatales bacterium]|nr:lactate utilization protein [Gemmatales bacterium]MDW8176228.1 lactate utilization protein [Gemmatales bacterium]